MNKQDVKFIRSFNRLVGNLQNEAVRTIREHGKKVTGDFVADIHTAEDLWEQEEAKRIAEEEAREEAEARKEFEKAKADAAYFTSAEFRAEVIEELKAEGATQLQAENRTRDQVRLFAEAARLNLM
jgi:hypothetical protein